MRHFALRLAAVLILTLGLAQAASAAEVWTFGHFVESDQTVAPFALDSVLYLMNKGASAHTCWVALLDEQGRELMVNGRYVCREPLAGRQASELCLLNINPFVKLKIHDRIVQVAGSTWPVILGEVRLGCDQPLAGLNATLYVTNYGPNGAFEASFTADQGKILP